MLHEQTKGLVLVVDPNPNIQKAVCSALSNAAYEPILADTIGEAHQQICFHRKEVWSGVVTDFDLWRGTAAELFVIMNFEGIHMPRLIVFSQLPQHSPAVTRTLKLWNANFCAKPPCPLGETDASLDTLVSLLAGGVTANWIPVNRVKDSYRNCIFAEDKFNKK